MSNNFVGREGLNSVKYSVFFVLTVRATRDPSPAPKISAKNVVPKIKNTVRFLINFISI